MLITPILKIAGMDFHSDLDNHGQQSNRWGELTKRQRNTASTPEVEQEEDPHAGWFV